MATIQPFRQAFDPSDKAICQIYRFTAFLESHPESHRISEDQA